LDELGKFAEQYEDAHGPKPSLQKEASAGLPRQPVGQYDGKKQDVPKASGKDERVKPKCFVCGKP